MESKRKPQARPPLPAGRNGWHRPAVVSPQLGSTRHPITTFRSPPSCATAGPSRFGPWLPHWTTLLPTTAFPPRCHPPKPSASSKPRAPPTKHHTGPLSSLLDARRPKVATLSCLPACWPAPGCRPPCLPGSPPASPTDMPTWPPFGPVAPLPAGLHANVPALLSALLPSRLSAFLLTPDAHASRLTPNLPADVPPARSPQCPAIQVPVDLLSGPGGRPPAVRPCGSRLAVEAAAATGGAAAAVAAAMVSNTGRGSSVVCKSMRRHQCKSAVKDKLEQPTCAQAKKMCNHVYLHVCIGICGLLDQRVTKMHSLPGQRHIMVFQNVRHPRVLDTAPDTLHWSGT